MSNKFIKIDKAISIQKTLGNGVANANVDINVNDSTKCRKIIKEAVGQYSVINDGNCTFHINGNDVNNKQIISDKFNDYFVNVGPN